MSIIPDSKIDYSYFGPGAKRRQREREADSRRHAKYKDEKKTKTERTWIDKTERQKTETAQNDPMRTIRDTRSRVMILALKYPTFEDAYEHHEDEIGSHLSRVTVSNLYREGKRMLKLFDRLGV